MLEVLSYNLHCSAGTLMVSQMLSVCSTRPDPALRIDGKMFKCSQVGVGSGGVVMVVGSGQRGAGRGGEEIQYRAF